MLVRRARVQRWAVAGQRLGYLLFAAALLLFFYGLVTDFDSTVSALVVGALVAGSVVLAPSILAGYAVRAANRADAEDDW